MVWKYKVLVETLSGLYYSSREIIAILLQAGLDPAEFDLSGSSNVVWTLAIKYLERRDKITDIIAVALDHYPQNPVLKDYLLENSTERKSAYVGDEPEWKGGIKNQEFEKRIGNNVLLLDISFLEIGLAKSKPVARIVTPNALATGFLITDTNLFLTANHVINQKPRSGEFKVQFNYQKDLNNSTAFYDEYEIDDSIFYTSIEDDWTIVKINGNPSSKHSYLQLQDNNIKKDYLVNIIQHPGGGHKKLALYNNLVTYVDERIIQYLTDTLPGASGSPVFDLSWNVVALHHSGGWFKETGAQGSQVCRNEGININRIKRSLKELNILTNQ